MQSGRGTYTLYGVFIEVKQNKINLLSNKANIHSKTYKLITIIRNNYWRQKYKE